jgi:hypothetical protein
MLECTERLSRNVIRPLGVAVAFLIYSSTWHCVAEPGSETWKEPISVSAIHIDFDNVSGVAFSDFALRVLRRYFALSSSASIIERQSRLPFIRDVEVSVHKHCLDSRLKGPWQRLRFEFMFVLDSAALKAKNVKEYILILRTLSGQYADWNDMSEPPAARLVEYSSPELTDLGSRFAAYVQHQISQICFDTHNLRLCDDTPNGSYE